MTMRTRTLLVCECGNEGCHTHSENDQPYSDMWDRYDLEGFSGGGKHSDDLEKMTCNKCGQTGKVRVRNA
jgi:hypothetical protein